jgi:hypothetical protein
LSSQGSVVIINTNSLTRPFPYSSFSIFVIFYGWKFIQQFTNFTLFYKNEENEEKFNISYFLETANNKKNNNNNNLLTMRQDFCKTMDWIVIDEYLFTLFVSVVCSYWWYRNNRHRFFENYSNLFNTLLLSIKKLWTDPILKQKRNKSKRSGMYVLFTFIRFRFSTLIFSLSFIIAQYISAQTNKQTNT